MNEKNADDSVDEPVLNRVCRYCSVQSTASGSFCQNCGKPYGKKTAPSPKILWTVITAVVVVLGVLAIIFFTQQEATKRAADDAHASQVAAASSAAASSSAAGAAASAEVVAAASAAAASEETERAVRNVYVSELEASIEKDAKARVKQGTLTGPIKRVSCTPTGGGSLDDLTSLTTTFECIAVNETNKDKTESGYVFTSTMNWDEATYSWHLGR
ncbi:hypothetical protein ACIGB6_04680 [Paeniglutamicibacter gangotriensis]|uniref:Uncharacterized protein n=1 Tax=Paeniglutamicibacter gangotriensis TaxID=254787 RepID=A0A5B0EEP0_9MICC|nr:hypothetical protein [Paeniglutamicibacter gangotriensis]KAA0977353.1 hypothetical protein FQ154_08620 [Paeniglutamicibacter gangotriensis]